MELTELHKSLDKVSETIALENVLKVSMNEGLIKGKFVFHVMTPKGKFTFGTDSSEETDGWVDTLNEELFSPPKPDIICKYIATYLYMRNYIMIATSYMQLAIIMLLYVYTKNST